MAKKSKFNYEDKYLDIDKEIQKRRGKWRLTSLAWMDFDDVSQIIRAHIYKKWDQWDQERSLLPWVNKIITNQFKNILRNNYHSFVKPCSNCPLNMSESAVENSCGFTKSGKQDNTCPLYKKWSKAKKHACDIKLPVSMENLQYDLRSFNILNEDIDLNVKKFHKEMGSYLSEKQFGIYKMLFIDKIDEEEIALKLGYKTSEKGRKAGYKQIKNLKSKFKEKALSLIKRKDIFL